MAMEKLPCALVVREHVTGVGCLPMLIRCRMRSEFVSLERARPLEL
jgi:hypothetical protein